MSIVPETWPIISADVAMLGAGGQAAAPPRRAARRVARRCQNIRFHPPISVEHKAPGPALLPQTRCMHDARGAQNTRAMAIWTRDPISFLSSPPCRHGGACMLPTGRWLPTTDGDRSDLLFSLSIQPHTGAAFRLEANMKDYTIATHDLRARCTGYSPVRSIWRKGKLVNWRDEFSPFVLTTGRVSARTSNSKFQHTERRLFLLADGTQDVLTLTWYFLSERIC
jgi:hypothetical protein